MPVKAEATKVLYTAPAFKTIGITHDEWRQMLTLAERIDIDKAAANVDGDLSWLTGNAVDPDGEADELGFPGRTYRDLLRTSFKEFDYAPFVNVKDERTQRGVGLLRSLGLLKSDARVVDMLKGFPLS